MTYYPKMAYRTVSLEPPLRAPTAIGLGDLPSTAWCSTANRQGTCSPISGVCIPMDAATLDRFKKLQRQTNRVLASARMSLIGVDGRIGPGTRKAVVDALTWLSKQSVLGRALALLFPPAYIGQQPCDWLAQRADAVGSKMEEAANALSAPAVADPSSSKPSQATPAGTVVHPPSDVIASAAGAGLFSYIPAAIKTPLGIAALVVGGLMIRKAMKSPGRGGRRARPARARARRRR